MAGSSVSNDVASGINDEELLMVARHGGGVIERSLAIVLLARRRGRLEELKELVDEITEN